MALCARCAKTPPMCACGAACPGCTQKFKPTFFARLQVTETAGQDEYLAGDLNGVATHQFGSYPKSFRLSDTCQTTGNLKTGEVHCPAGCAASGGAVWGTGPYTGDSSICRAAIHQGLISDAGGSVRAVSAPGQASYSAGDRNGVATAAYGAYARSFVLKDSCTAQGRSKVGQTVHCPAGCAHLAPYERATTGVWGSGPYTGDSSVCRAAIHQGLHDNDGGDVEVADAGARASFSGGSRNGVTAQPFGSYPSSFTLKNACSHTGRQRSGEVQCPARCLANGGAVWGTGPYTADSSVCKAAIHQGVITDAGGKVTVTSAPGQASYAAGAQNGVATSAYGAYPASLEVVDNCSDTGFAKEGTVRCPAGCAAKAGPVWGTGPYTRDSSVCRAAIHRGLIPDAGGPVVANPVRGYPVYPAGDRHGVRTQAYGRCGNSIEVPSGCTTTGGKLCKFPFSYAGYEHYRCTTMGETGRPWCATALKDGGTYKTWGWCPAAAPPASACATGCKAAGGECHFPFQVQRRVAPAVHHPRGAQALVRHVPQRGRDVQDLAVVPRAVPRGRRLAAPRGQGHGRLRLHLERRRQRRRPLGQRLAPEGRGLVPPGGTRWSATRPSSRTACGPPTTRTWSRPGTRPRWPNRCRTVRSGRTRARGRTGT